MVKITTPELDAFNNSTHSITKIAPNKLKKENEIQVLMNIREQKKNNYPRLDIGDHVRVPVIQ